MILAVNGFLRKSELVQLEFDHMQICDDMYLLKVSRKKGIGAKKLTTFIINDPVSVNVMNSYFSKFPEGLRTGRILKRMDKNNRIVNQVIGENTIATYPKMIATFLKLPNACDFTSHAFRRSAATIYADSGATLPQLKAGGGWNSSTVAESHINDSVASKKHIAHAFNMSPEKSYEKRSNPLVETGRMYSPGALHIEFSNSMSNNVTVVIPNSVYSRQCMHEVTKFPAPLPLEETTATKVKKVEEVQAIEETTATKVKKVEEAEAIEKPDQVQLPLKRIRKRKELD